jgi:poly(A) polymerase
VLFRSLDQTIGVELNLRRSMRQEMTNLLLNLALLINNRQGNNWPKWLKRKSYFQRARSFYSLYIEATTGEQLFQPQNMEPSPPALQEEPNPPPINNDTQQHPARPAFSRKTKGGIFGFKK